MTYLNALKSIAIISMMAGTSASFSHDGHAMAGNHWHATDAWGFVALGGMVAVAIWLSMRDK